MPGVRTPQALAAGHYGRWLSDDCLCCDRAELWASASSVQRQLRFLQQVQWGELGGSCGWCAPACTLLSKFGLCERQRERLTHKCVYSSSALAHCSSVCVHQSWLGMMAQASIAGLLSGYAYSCLMHHELLSSSLHFPYFHPQSSIHRPLNIASSHCCILDGGSVCLYTEEPPELDS